MPQRIQRTAVQVAALACFGSAVCTQQMPFLHVQIERVALVGTAVSAARKLRHKAAFTHGAQLKNSLDHARVCFALADHVQAVEQKPKLLFRLLPGGRKGVGHFGQIHGYAYAFQTFGDIIKDVLNVCLLHHIHAAAFYQCELGITEQTAAAEQLIGDPHAVFGQCRDHPQLRGQDRKDPVCFPVLCFFQHQAHRHKGFHRLCLLSAVPDVCSRDTGECSPCRQTPASWPERSWGIPPSLHVLLDSVRYSSGIHARKICPVNGCCCSA